MSEFQTYHALAGQGDDPQNPNFHVQQTPSQYHPSPSSPPQGYQQSPGIAAFPPQQHPYDGTPASAYSNNASSQGQSYFPQQGPGPIADQGQGAMGGLTAQMGGLGIGGDPAGSVRAHRKKDRHAYHHIGAPEGSSQAFNGIPQAGFGTVSQYLNADTPQPGPPSPYLGQSVTPVMSQFPAPGGVAMSPMGQPAQQGFGIPNPSIPATGGSAQGRVDPEQIPSVPKSRDIPAHYYLDHLYPTMEQHLPPPAAISFIAHDQGNSSPKFARLTLNSIPSTAESLHSTGLPLGLIVQPLAALQPGETEIPVLDFGESGPPRCRRCRTYINPFMTFRSGGNKLVCNMCTFPNEVSSEYFAPTDPSGVRVDRAQRPELTMGTVDFMVPKEYWSKDPVGLKWLFLVDVSQEAVNRGFLEAFCEGIIAALYSEDDLLGVNNEKEGEEESKPQRALPPGSKVGIITFDKEVHFYNLSPHLDKAQMLVMTDINEPFVPLSEGLFVDPYESETVIKSLLTQLPTLFSQVKNAEPALLSGLDAALSALSSTGGKIVCSLSALPTWGPGRLFLRDHGANHDTDGGRKLFTTEHPAWLKTASKMVECGVGVDFFLAAASGGFLDNATVGNNPGHVSSLSGGETFFYPNFHVTRDTPKMVEEIKHTVRRETGYQCLMKVRCSNGLQVSAYHGNFLQHTFGADLEFGAIDADKAFAVMFSYDGKLDPKLDAHFQAALLYTTSSGERRVRCCNIVASVTEKTFETMKYIDQDAVVSIIAKEAAAKMPDRTLKEIRAVITEKTIDILAGYRKNFSGDHPPGQLVLPENLKEFSMYMLGLVKSRAFKGGQEPTDRRVHDMRLLKSIGPLEMSLYLYPRIIPIHNLDPSDGFANEAGHLRVPPTLRASFARIEEGGAYIVDNGQQCILWLHAQVSPNLLEDLFGPGQDSLRNLDPYLSSLPVLETHLNAQVRNLLQYLKTIRGSKAMTLQLARQGLDGAEYEFARLLVEDRNNEAQSYVDWLVHIHRHIQLELTGQRRKDDTSEGGLSGLVHMRPPYW
ncbi:MAG: COPII coat Sec23p-Sfb3p heterodimer component [Cirrosporium novae-zelandiae]|nr:MAG: COPII coat Sec23p-Sfb3p heterodimer component [Cirrosporium novae-zelandiae]